MRQAECSRQPALALPGVSKRITTTRRCWRAHTSQASLSIFEGSHQHRDLRRQGASSSTT
jgi:hypothetical protein